jgi:dCTP deaminase
MILVDHQIRDLCWGEVPWYIRLAYFLTGNRIGRIKPLIEDYYNPDLINPASIDIRIGYTGQLRFLPSKTGYADLDLSIYTKETPFMFQPGDRLLVASMETFNLPNFLCAQFRLKSSRGREWYEHMEAGFCDPGWNGSKLTMEIINMDAAPLPIYPGLKMGQLVFSLTMGKPKKSYAVTGRYNNDKTVSESKG